MPGKLHVKLKIAAALVGLTPIVSSASSVLQVLSSPAGTYVYGSGSSPLLQTVNGALPSKPLKTGYGPGAMTSSYSSSSTSISSTQVYTYTSSNESFMTYVSSDTYFTVSGGNASFDLSLDVAVDPNAPNLSDDSFLEAAYYISDTTTGTTVASFNLGQTPFTGSSTTGTLVAGDTYELYSLLETQGFGKFMDSSSETLTITSDASPVPLPAPLYSGLALLPCAYLGRRWTAKSRG